MTNPNPEIHHIPLTQIDTTTLTRDRTHLAPEPLAELRTSILTHGLRLPIELLRLQHPGDHPYTLISGLRRLTVFQTLATEGLTAFTKIPALIRETQTLPQAYTAMIEENAIRADLSPYEQGRIATQAVTAGAFPTTDEAIDTLYASSSRPKRSRLRAIAHVADELDHILSAPEEWSQNQLLRLSSALRAGYTDIIIETLKSQPDRGAKLDWSAIQPYLIEAEAELTGPDAPQKRPGRPRRILHLRQGLTIRREVTRQGYALRFSGREATGEFLDTVMDEIERWLQVE